MRPMYTVLIFWGVMIAQGGLLAIASIPNPTPGILDLNAISLSVDRKQKEFVKRENEFFLSQQAQMEPYEVSAKGTWVATVVVVMILGGLFYVFRRKNP